MKNYKRLPAYIKPYLGRFGLAIICIICASGANLYLPWIIKDMIDKVLAETRRGGGGCSRRKKNFGDCNEKL